MIYIARETLLKIETSIRDDQGSAFRVALGKVIPHMKDAFRESDAPFRSHLGASMIGRKCGRDIWYGWRWHTKPHFSGRLMRLFNRGHLEEARFIAMLLSIGVQVFQQDENGNQFRISELNGHFGGSGDGVGVGVPDLAPGSAALLEFKTHNDKSFAKLAGKNWAKFVSAMIDPKLPPEAFEGEGVREAKPEHYVQMQTYMRKMGIPVALYAAVNKNDDSIYMELVMLDTRIADEFLERGRKIVMLRTAPARISNSPGWYECKFCDHRPVCHLKAAPDRNCRSCAYSDPFEDGKWYCTHDRNPASGAPVELSKEQQLSACSLYEVIPE